MLLAGCTGTLRLGGWVPDRGDDDDSAVTDDDDDLTPANDDDAADDDDATIAGGEVFCGLELAAMGDGALTAVTGDAFVELDFGSGGPEFEALWSGCEARHWWDAAGNYVCGIRWDVASEAYVTQRQATALVMRFTATFTESDNTCYPGHPQGGDFTADFRLRVPYDDGELELLRAPQPNTPPAQMQPWAELGWTGQGEEPADLDFAYDTGFTPGEP